MTVPVTYQTLFVHAYVDVHIQWEKGDEEGKGKAKGTDPKAGKFQKDRTSPRQLQCVQIN